MQEKFRIPFPEHLKAVRSLFPELLSILEYGHTSDWYASLWAEECVTQSALCARTETVHSLVDRGVVMRLLAHGRSYEVGVNHFTAEQLRETARNFRQRVEIGIQQRSAGPIPPYHPKAWAEELAQGSLPEELIEQIPSSPTPEKEVHFSVPCVVPPSETTLGILADKARAIRNQTFKIAEDVPRAGSGEMADRPHIADIRVLFRQQLRTHIFVDRTRNISQCLPITLGYVMGISTCGTSGRSLAGGMGGLEIAEFTSESLKQATFLPLALAVAPRLKPGRYQVITGPDVTGVIAHEAFGHTQEGDTCMKGRSIAPLLRNQNRRVGNSAATIINHAGIFSMEHLTHGSNGSYFFDHEGQFSRSHILLAEGWLQLPMADLATSLILGIPRTANGKRESWRRPIMTRQTNTFFTPGEQTLDELIAQVSYGFLARYAHGGMEDPKGGSLTAGTEYFEEIRDGKLTGCLFTGPTGGHIELSDPVFTLLERIRGKTQSCHPLCIPENKFGGCGKYHKEGVDAGCGGPYILWESINCG